MKKEHSWTFVILFLIFFWPLGLFFLYQKVSSGVSSNASATKSLTIIKWVFVFIASCGLISSFSDPAEEIATDIVMIVFFSGGAILLHLYTKKVRAQEKKNRLYLSLIRFENVVSIKEIAKETGDTLEVAMDTIAKLIEIGKLPGIEINVHKKELVYGPGYIEEPVSELERMVVMKCSGCGAMNKITRGSFAECEYCGSILEGKV